jgi:DNA-binding NarL/FixJ family response regulator
MITLTSSVKSCFRCGCEFRGERTVRICPACRKPRPRAPILRDTSLSFREKQVVGLILQAKLNKEIAYELHLSEGTIKEYLYKVFRKVGVNSRTELAIWALTHIEASRMPSAVGECAVRRRRICCAP